MWACFILHMDRYIIDMFVGLVKYIQYVFSLALLI